MNSNCRDASIQGGWDTKPHASNSSSSVVGCPGGLCGRPPLDTAASSIRCIRRPFLSSFRAFTWNCRSLWANLSSQSIQFANSLLDACDFGILCETRENESRGLLLRSHFQDCTVYSSGIDQYKGGVAIVLKNSFINQFVHKNWVVHEKGRIGALHLQGAQGSLSIIAVYCDPGHQGRQKQQLSSISQAIDPMSHCLVAGDFNFVVSEHDRIVKATCKKTGAQDKAVAEKWRQVCDNNSLKEWGDTGMTCESSSSLSRIDRIYSNIHDADVLSCGTYCHSIGYPRHLSDHCPLAFGISTRSRPKRPCIPEWLVKDDLFQSEFKDELKFLISDRPTSALDRLDAIKKAAFEAAASAKRQRSEQEATSTDEKLTVAIAFVRALHSGHTGAAAKLQKRFAPLREVDVQSPLVWNTEAFDKVKSIIAELSRISMSDRIEELRASKGLVLDSSYRQRKQSLDVALRKALPGNHGGIRAVFDETTGSIFTDGQNIARLLSAHWEQTFTAKPTDALLRKRWCDAFRDRMQLSNDDVRPTLADVESVLKSLPRSAPGPDGLPFALFGLDDDNIKHILYDIAIALYNGSEVPDERFNAAYLVCLPKKASGVTTDGVEYFDPASTRPLSIVDSVNRIIASIFRLALERATACWVSSFQQGFVPGRELLLNVVEVDWAAQKISLTHTRGAIVLLDFKAAFPSVAHDYIWEALTCIGIPASPINALRCFYAGNRHEIKIDGQYYPSFTATSGMRQGCPLSGILFALCADLLLRRIGGLLSGASIVRGYADDTAIVLDDYLIYLPSLSIIFHEFALISGLSLNVSKTIFIPLWHYTSSRSVRNLLRECVPAWANFAIATTGRYLGFVVGPGNQESSWDSVLAKYDRRVLQWASRCSGLLMSILAYKFYIHSILGFVAQLCEFPPDFQKRFEAALRRMVPGPGNWISHTDLTHLKQFGFPAEFPDPFVMGTAAKLRVICQAVPHAAKLHQELLQVQSEYLHRPFKDWHYRSFAAVLVQNLERAQQAGINVNLIYRNAKKARKKMKLQEQFLAPVRSLLYVSYNMEERVRKRIARWKLAGPPGVVTRRIIRNIQRLSKLASARVVACSLRSLFNGWVTDQRMRGVLTHSIRGCVLGCCDGQDRIEHYAVCPILWELFSKQPPMGLGISRSCRSLSHFLLAAEGLDDGQLKLMAHGVYSMYRVHGLLKHDTAQLDKRSVQALVRWCFNQA